MTTTVRAPALQFLPIPAEVARRARRERKDQFGHDLTVQRTQAPCRVCLKISESEEDLILLSYRPLPDKNPYAEVGPIFIHERECTDYSALGDFPEDFLTRELVLRAYDREGRIFDAMVARAGEASRIASRFLRNSEVEEVHVRHPSYTCFDFKIVRNQ